MVGNNGSVPGTTRSQPLLEPLVSASASAALFERALEVTPGGVNSPVRAFGRRMLNGFIDCGCPVNDSDVKGVLHVTGRPLTFQHGNASLVNRRHDAKENATSSSADRNVPVFIRCRGGYDQEYR